MRFAKISIWLLFNVVLLAGFKSPANKITNATRWGSLQNDSYETVKENFGNPDMIYAPFLFWFWDEPLDSSKINIMSEEILRQRFNPGYIHGRISMYELLSRTPGLKDAMHPHPGLPDDEWMSGKWLDNVKRVAETAKGNNAYTAYNDEYMWPSGQAKGRVVKGHPELCYEYLTFSVKDVDAREKVSLPASFFTLAARLDAGADTIKYKYTSRDETIPPAGLLAFDVKGMKTLGQVIEVKEPWLYEISLMTTFYFTRTRSAFTVELREDNPQGRLITSKYFPEGQYEDDKPTIEIPEILREGTKVYVGLIPDNTAFDGDIAWWYKPGNLYLDGMSFVNDEPAGEDLDFHIKMFYKTAKHSGDAYYEADICSSTVRMIGEGAGFEWEAPADGKYRVYTFTRNQGGTVNYLDKRGAERFVNLAHKPYIDSLGDNLLINTVPGALCDNEGGYGSLPWSIQLPVHYKSKTGNDIRLMMPMVIDRDTEGVYAKARYDYLDCVSDLYTGFFGTVNDYLQKRNLYYVSNFWEESLQWVARCVGDLMKMQRRFSLPGTDALTMKIYDPHDLMESHSVAAFEGRRLELEFMGAGGWGDLTPKNLKAGINAVTAWGANHIVPHGVFNSRALRGNVWTPDYSNRLPMWNYMHLWTDFIRRTSYIASQGNVSPDVLILNPLSSVWALWGNSKDLWGSDGANITVLNNLFHPKAREINRIYSDALRDLIFNRVEYLVADRYYMDKMEVNGGILSYDNMKFRAVVMPPMVIMSLKTAGKLVEFAKNGGYVYSLGELPSASVENGMNDGQMIQLMSRLKSMNRFKAVVNGLKPELSESVTALKSHIGFLKGKFEMLQKHRIIDGRHFFWLANNDDTEHIAELRIDNIQGAVSIWNCETGEINPVSSKTVGDNMVVRVKFMPNDGFWLVVDPKHKPDGKMTDYPTAVTVAELSGEWSIEFSKEIQPDLENKVELPLSISPKLLTDWKYWPEIPGNFSGLLDYKKTFVIDVPVENAIIDLGNVYHFAEVLINGVSCGSRLWAPYRFAVSNLKSGENEIKIRVGNLVNNNYDMEYERILLGRHVPENTTYSGLTGPVKILLEK